jgi:hypothetical protein
MKKTFQEPVHVRASIVATRGFETLLDAGGPQAHWLPTSEIHDNGDGTFTMERWLAFERGIS